MSRNQQRSDSVGGLHCDVTSGLRGGYTVTEMLVVIAIIGVMMALLLPAVQMVREAGRKTTCANNLMNIGKAFSQHNIAWESYPTAGLSSAATRSMGPNGEPQPARFQRWGWAYQILPYMEKDMAYFNPNDDAAAGLIVPNYFCPSRRRPQSREGIDCGLAARTLRGALDYAGNAGRGMPGQQIYPAFPDAWINQNGTVIPVPPADLVTNPPVTMSPNGLSKNLAVGVGNVPDGEAYTILVGERNFNRQRMADPTQQDEDNGYIAGYSWDTIRWGYDTPAHDRTDASDFDTRFGSSHNMIAQFLLCDGSVKSINYTIALPVFQGLCHREDKISPNVE